MATPELQPDQNFWGAINEEAEKGGGGAQFGQLDIKPSRYIHWVNAQPVDVTPEVFATLPAEEKSLELMFTVDIKGMNPSLEWTYERKMRPGDKDWHKILKPSLVELLGEDSMKKGTYSATLQGLVGKYIEVADVPQIKSPEYNTIKFVRIFNSKEECFTAYKERFPDTDGGAAVPAAAPISVPPAYTAETWQSVVPSIKKALETSSPPEVATQYQVDVSFIAEIAGQS